MYLFSHLATSIEVSFINIKKFIKFQSGHYHFRMVLNGAVSIEDSDEKYILEKDDIILLHPEVLYKFDYVSDNILMDVSIPANFFESLMKPGYQVICNSAIGRKNNYVKLRNILTDMIVIYQKEDNQLGMCSLLYALIDCMNEFFLSRIQPENASVIDQHYAVRIARIAGYINNNYQMPLNQQTLADYMFLTPQYLSKFIKQNFGLTFNKYLNQVRMQHALEELRETDHSITTIAFNNGFASTTTFNKIFKELYNTTPTTYRQSLGSSSLSQEYVPNKLDIGNKMNKLDDIKVFLSTPGTDSNLSEVGSHSIHIDTSNKEDMHHPWLEILNVGLAQNILSHNFHQVFLECQEKFHFKYARFQNIFSEKIISPLHNIPFFDFTNFDDIMDFFHECSIYPFIELANKPEKIAYNADKAGLVQKQSCRSADVPYRLSVFDALLKHSLNRYGLDYVSHWKFELWAEQDENLDPVQTPEEYVQSYVTYSEVIKKYLPSVRIGGPGFNTSSNIENFIHILNTFMRNRIIPGFISIYLFSYDSNAYASNSDQSDMPPYRIISPDPQRLKKVFAHVKGLTRQILPSPVPIYVTEFNSNLSPENFVANSSFQAAFICKNALDLLYDADGLGYWLFTDISNEYVDSRFNNIAGIGLIDSYGVKKPSYFAYEFLTKLGNNLISYGPNYIMTSSHDNKYQILAYNYTHYNKYFCINCCEKISFQNTYSVFEEAEKSSLQFELNNLSAGRYKIRKHILNRQNGSFLDEYLKILENGNSTPEEILYMMLNLQNKEAEYYKSICIPRQDISYVTCDGTMSLALTLEPHEVNYIIISRKL